MVSNPGASSELAIYYPTAASCGVKLLHNSVYWICFIGYTIYTVFFIPYIF